MGAARRAFWGCLLGGVAGYVGGLLVFGGAMVHLAACLPGLWTAALGSLWAAGIGPDPYLPRPGDEEDR